MRYSHHTSRFGKWDVAQRDADPRLGAFVIGYFASSSHLPTAVRERHLPSTEVPLLLNFGVPHRRLNPADTHTWTSFDGAWVVGLHESHQLSDAVGERHFMVVRFTPIGAHMFLGVPMHQISNRAVELKDLDSRLARTIESRVGVAAGWTERFDAVEAIVAERIAEANMPGALSCAWNELNAADGRVTLRSLVSQVECSHRTLIAQFRDCIGLAPKTAARLLRFTRAVRTLNSRSHDRLNEPSSKPYIEISRREVPPGFDVDWAALAADCGYFDQAHFIKEFRHFAGSTPGGFLRQVSCIG